MKTKVKELRTAAKLTQRQLAEFVGVSSRTIISIETGRYSPSLQPAFYLSSRTKQRDNCDPYEAPETRKNSGFIPQQISAVFQLFSVGPTALICKNSPADGIKIDAVPRKCISDRLLIFYKTPA